MKSDRDVVHALVKVRCDKGLTQAAIADRIGISRSSVSRLETNPRYCPLISTLVRYADAVGAAIVVVDREAVLS